VSGQDEGSVQVTCGQHQHVIDSWLQDLCAEWTRRGQSWCSGRCQEDTKGNAETRVWSWAWKETVKPTQHTEY
jgi:hypothetical protein